MKPILPIFTTLALTAVSAQSALLWPAGSSNTLTTTLAVASGDYFQGKSQTLDINNGGTLLITDASYETIIQQTDPGTSTINVNIGGAIDASGSSGNKGLRFWVGNANVSGIGILNLNGGSIDTSPMIATNSFVLGSNEATGLFNITAGSATLGSLNFGTGTGIVDFTTGSTGSLTVTGADLAFYEDLFINGELTHGGTNTGTFAENFNYTGGVGGTLTATSAVPEPSSAVLFSLGSFALILRRRKK